MSAPEKDLIEQVGPYELVARQVGAEHHGWLWTTESNKKRSMLLAVKGTSNADAIAKLKEGHYKQVVSKAPETPSSQRTCDGWHAIWKYLNAAQIAMLMALYHAPDRRLSTVALSKVAGYKDHRGVNRWLGEVGFLLFREAPRRLLPDELRPDGSPIFTFALCSGSGSAAGSDDKAWVWQMRPEVASGLELAGRTSTLAP